MTTATTDYKLIKFARSNQGTCINQRPIVSVGERVEKGDVIADGPSTDQGEIALGKNVLIGFMTWEGYNYEDAVLINERWSGKTSSPPSILKEYETEARDTKLGRRRSPAISRTSARTRCADLDDRGIIRVGAEVRRRYPGRQGHARRARPS